MTSCEACIAHRWTWTWRSSSPRTTSTETTESHMCMYRLFFAPIIKCAPRSTRTSPSMSPESGCRTLRVAVACRCGSSRITSTCACAPIRACAHAQQHPPLFHTIGNKLQHSHLHHRAMPFCSLQARAMQKYHTPCASLASIAKCLALPYMLHFLLHSVNAHHLPLQYSQVCDRALPDALEASTRAANTAPQQAQGGRPTPRRGEQYRRRRRLALRCNRCNQRRLR